MVVVPVLVLLFVALCLFYEAICFISYLVLFCSCIFSVLLALRLPRLGKRELILVLFVRLFDLCLFAFVCFLFLLVSGKGCGLWLWHFLDFSLTFFLSVCVSLWCFTDELEDLYADQIYICNWSCIKIKGEVSRKTSLSSTVVFLLTIPRWFLCCSYSLFMRLWFHM